MHSRQPPSHHLNAPRPLPRCRTGMPSRPQSRPGGLQLNREVHCDDDCQRIDGEPLENEHSLNQGPAREQQLEEQPLEALPSWQRAIEIGWDKPLLQLAFASCQAVEVHSPLSEEDAQGAVVRAVATWNAVNLPVQIEVVDNSLPTADILVGWTFANSDPDRRLDWRTQAHADFPPGNSLIGPPLPLHFNADFRWGNQQAGCFDVETVALHELGHCLGLVFHSGLDTIMYDALREAPFFVRHQLDLETIARARLLYR